MSKNYYGLVYDGTLFMGDEDARAAIKKYQKGGTEWRVHCHEIPQHGMLGAHGYVWRVWMPDTAAYLDVRELTAHTPKTATPKRVRNEAARCGNCPYSKPFVGNKVVCRFEHPDAEHGSPVLSEIESCGQHPDFWKEEA